MKKEQTVKRRAEQLNKEEVEQLTFSGLYFLGVGFLWQMMWQLSKKVDYSSMVRVSKEVFHWASLGLVALTITYLIGYMIYLETKKQIDSKGLLIKYFVGLVLGYVVAKVILGSL
jgi:hypothetical protein